MSRAFVKEQDDAIEELPERSISEHPNDVTPEGAARIDAELGAARTVYAAAQKSGDRAALASTSRDVRYWSSRRATARIIPPPEDHDRVHFGATVKIARDDGREQTFRIVGEGRGRSRLRIYLSCLALGASDVRQACGRCRSRWSRRG